MAKRKIKEALSIKDIDADDHPDDGGELQPGPGKESFKLASFWKSQVEMVDESQKKWIKRGNMVLKRYRDERNRADEDTGQRRMNLLWANIKVMKPAIYSKCPTPIVDRKFLDRDPTGRLSSQMLERSLVNELTNDFHAAMTSAVYDRLLPGRGIVWPRYEPTIGVGPSIPANNSDGIEDPLVKIGEETGDKDLTEESDTEEELETTGEQVLAEKVIFDYVNWRDFYLFPAKARVWEEVQAVGKRVHISKKEAKDRFGEKIGKALQVDTTPLSQDSVERQTYSDSAIFQDINERSIILYEIWNKSDQRVYWVSTGYDYLCDVKDDPLELKGFFPVPRPLQATTTTDTLIPVPDYVEWQDQAIQIDELTKRIAMLTKACKIVGVYNATNTQINTIFQESVENQLVPVDQWAMFADSGGLKGQVDFIPIDQIQACIKTLQEVRQQCMIDLDQITGLSDIMRGTSDSRETLGGIRLKNNNAGTRLSDSQEEVARFARDTINIAAEIISKHFDDQTIIESSGILFEEELQPDTIIREWEAQQPEAPEPPQMPTPMGQSPQLQALQPPAPMGMPPMLPPPGGAPMGNSPQAGPPMSGNNVIPFPGGPGGMSPQQMGPIEPPKPDPEILIVQKIEKAISLLRKDVTRCYRISIETDSTIFGDRVQERQDATEFVGAVGGYMKQFESVAQTLPEFLPLAGKMLQWAVRKYRTGRDLESEVDSFVLKMEKKAKQMAENPPPDPEQKKADAEIEQMKMEAQMQQANDQRAAEIQQANDQRDAQIQQSKDEREAQIENMHADLEREKMTMELEIARENHKMEMEKMRMTHSIAISQHNMKLQQTKVQVEADKESHEQELEHQEQAHELKKKENKEQHSAKLQQIKLQKSEAKKKAQQPKKKAS